MGTARDTYVGMGYPQNGQDEVIILTCVDLKVAQNWVDVLGLHKQKIRQSS
jgi:hypothetical protein